MPKLKKDDYLKNYLYERPKTKKPRKVKIKNKKKGNKGFKFLSFVIGLAVVFLIANLFAGFVDFNKEVLGQKYFEADNLYAIELANYSNSADAYNFAEDVKQQLGAGYVVNDNETFRVLVSAYNTRANADTVLNNLKENGVTANIYEIKLPSTYLNLELSEEQEASLKNIFDMFKSGYEKLYDLSIELDKSQKTVTQISEEIDTFYNNSSDEIELFNTLFDKNASEIIYTKIYVNNFKDYLKELKEFDNSSTLFSSKIKETYFKLINCYINLAKEL